MQTGMGYNHRELEQRWKEAAGDVKLKTEAPFDLWLDYGYDCLNLYQMSAAHTSLEGEWSEDEMEGIYRFLGRIWKLASETIGNYGPAAAELCQLRFVFRQKYNSRMEKQQEHLAAAALMEYVKKLLYYTRKQAVDAASFQLLTETLAGVTPYLALELSDRMKNAEGLKGQAENEPVSAERMLTIPVQVNGKIKAKICISSEAEQKEILQAARDVAAPRFTGRIQKEFYVPEKIVSFFCEHKSGV